MSASSLSSLLSPHPHLHLLSVSAVFCITPASAAALPLHLTYVGRRPATAPPMRRPSSSPTPLLCSSSSTIHLHRTPHGRRPNTPSSSHLCQIATTRSTPTSSSTSSTPPQRASVTTGLGISNPTSACVVNISAATSSSTGAVECRRILRARAGSRSTNLAGGTRAEAAQACGGR